MKKKLVIALLVLCVSAAMTGCGNQAAQESTADGMVSENDLVSTGDVTGNEAASEDKETESKEAEASVAEESKEETKAEEKTEGKTEAKAEPKAEAVLAAEYTVDALDKTMYAQKAVNLRKGPSTTYEKGGALSKGEQVHVTGKASTGWYQLENGLFVSNNYLGDKKPETIVASNKTGNTGSTGNGNTYYDPTLMPGEGGYWQGGVFYPDKPGGGNTEPAPKPSQEPETPAEQVYTYEVTLLPELLTLVNNKRAENGVHAYEWNTAREEDAKARAQELVNDFSHTTPGGYGSAAESITMYGPDVQEIFDAYSRSKMHNSALNIEDTYQLFVSANCTEYLNGKVNRNFNVVMIDWE